uniref:Uncharacterized protein n=1 Tax=Anguilla anguilla TaxID=7936 RepID=A0A0E9PPI4_ANGAN
MKYSLNINILISTHITMSAYKCGLSFSESSKEMY